MPSHLCITPECEKSGSSGKEWNIAIAGRLRRLATMVNRVIIANGEGQFVNLATLDLDGKRGETLADLACVEHIGAAFQNRCKHFIQWNENDAMTISGSPVMYV